MACELYTPECEGRDCIECESNECEMAGDCMEFNPDGKCVGAGVSKCDDYVSREEVESDMHPNETHEEFMEHENLD